MPGGEDQTKKELKERKKKKEKKKADLWNETTRADKAREEKAAVKIDPAMLIVKG